VKKQGKEKGRVGQGPLSPAPPQLKPEWLGEGAKGKSPYPYKKLPQTPTPNPLREEMVAQASRLCIKVVVM
jgi:hypothetical protein